MSNEQFSPSYSEGFPREIIVYEKDKKPIVQDASATEKSSTNLSTDKGADAISFEHPKSPRPSQKDPKKFTFEGVSPISSGGNVEDARDAADETSPGTVAESNEREEEKQSILLSPSDARSPCEVKEGSNEDGAVMLPSSQVSGERDGSSTSQPWSLYCCAMDESFIPLMLDEAKRRGNYLFDGLAKQPPQSPCTETLSPSAMCSVECKESRSSVDPFEVYQSFHQELFLSESQRQHHAKVAETLPTVPEEGECDEKTLDQPILSNEATRAEEWLETPQAEEAWTSQRDETNIFNPTQASIALMTLGTVDEVKECKSHSHDNVACPDAKSEATYRQEEHQMLTAALACTVEESLREVDLTNIRAEMEEVIEEAACPDAEIDETDRQMHVLQEQARAEESTVKEPASTRDASAVRLTGPLRVEGEVTTSEEPICQPQVPQVEVGVMNAACVGSICQKKSTDKETAAKGDVEELHVNLEWKTPLSPEFFHSLEVGIAPSDELLNKSHAPIRDTSSASASSYFCNGFESFPDLCISTPVSGVKAGITSFLRNNV